mmetsp:Transcript_11066/g.14466  ORF Transcript_11066/g.14466 Transcript_11066/m.14466 type:complete len:560 (+) Transcript_11066:204-1883(+)|eukprot:CAMPEP_0116059008 /NCGR_PEP_ID=MMETSP0322-20121206/5544_1 /TAXON_ID=163516 /ORGANISM="Leptocylindrus danicus var. apora, Strain B651" /LENGTH=559 /DNA_ID=CAMNT_0003543315 /DNA_START=121 /DNA_END=1800 /DNA_ORIENTATION=-
MVPNTNPSQAFSVDLLENAKLHRKFLQDLHKTDVSLRFLPARMKQAEAQNALSRYRKYWLPLVIKHANAKSGSAARSSSFLLVPPADIAWLWHCHRLAPLSYMEFLRKEFLGHENLSDLDDENILLPFSFQHLEDGLKEEDIYYCNVDDENKIHAKKTMTFWETYYPNESFFLSEISPERSNTIINLSTTLQGFDLLQSVERQASFLWQISSPSFEDADFMNDGLQNYLRFLSLRRAKDVNVPIIVPTYQIDLFWHTHILSSIKKYDADCRRIMGFSFNHDDSLNDRSEGSDLNRAFQATSKLWLETFGEQYRVEGGMYRGEPPENFYSSEWSFVSTQVKSTKNNCLIGVVGAGSSNVNESANVTLEWLSSFDYTPDGKPTFEAMAEKSSEKGVNANPKREGYIFGEGSRGVGYYHEQTREAYQIICTRLQKKITYNEGKIKENECAMIMCCCLIPCIACDIKYFDEEIKKTRAILAVMEERKDASHPQGFARSKDTSSGPGRRKDNKDNRETGTQDNNHETYGYSNIYWDASDLNEAAGCGGGGGACGAEAAACGADM